VFAKSSAAEQAVKCPTTTRDAIPRVRRFDSLEVSTRALVKQAIIGGAVPGSCLFAAAPLSPAALCAMLGDLRFGVTPATRFVLSSMKRGTWELPWGPKESRLRIARPQHAVGSSSPGRGAQVAHLAFLACDISFIGAFRPIFRKVTGSVLYNRNRGAARAPLDPAATRPLAHQKQDRQAFAGRHDRPSPSCALCATWGLIMRERTQGACAGSGRHRLRQGNGQNPCGVWCEPNRTSARWLRAATAAQRHAATRRAGSSVQRHPALITA